MNLHQMNVSFDPHHDRLLLKVSTTDAQEFRFWFTRRMVLRIWPRMVTVMEAAPQVASNPLAAAPLEFRHAAAVQKTDFATPYVAEGKTPALAAEPLLVSQFSLSETMPEHYTMVLAAKDGASVNLKLPGALLHGFIQLLQDTARGAEWGVTLGLPTAVMASTAIN